VKRTNLMSFASHQEKQKKLMHSFQSKNKVKYPRNSADNTGLLNSKAVGLKSKGSLKIKKEVS
jgi:hypothetical protein